MMKFINQVGSIAAVMTLALLSFWMGTSHGDSGEELLPKESAVSGAPRVSIESPDILSDSNVLQVYRDDDYDEGPALVDVRVIFYGENGTRTEVWMDSSFAILLEPEDQFGELWITFYDEDGGEWNQLYSFVGSSEFYCLAVA